MRWPIALLVLAGCDTPAFHVHYRESSGPAQTCAPALQPAGVPVTCNQVPLDCPAVLSVRAMRAGKPDAQYVDVCTIVGRVEQGTNDLCAIRGIPLVATGDIPKETLDVQVAVWPKRAIELKPMGTEVDCDRYMVEFDQTNGFPKPPKFGDESPALGGRGFFHPGDDEVEITLGCADMASVTSTTCIGSTNITVQATVEDFDTGLSVGPPFAPTLSVEIGEPQQRGGSWSLISADTRPLGNKVVTPTPVWREDAVDIAIRSAACITVLDEGAEETIAVRCRTEPAKPPQLDLTGTRLAKETLRKILDALALHDFPDGGLTVGVVLDQVTPKAGYTVTTGTPATIEYLTPLRDGTGGTQTSASGIFVSRDAPFGTSFRASNGTISSQEVIGGLIGGKVTIVVLQVAAGGA